MDRGRQRKPIQHGCPRLPEGIVMAAAQTKKRGCLRFLLRSIDQTTSSLRAISLLGSTSLISRIYSLASSPALPVEFPHHIQGSFWPPFSRGWLKLLSTLVYPQSAALPFLDNSLYSKKSSGTPSLITLADTQIFHTKLAGNQLRHWTSAQTEHCMQVTHLVVFLPPALGAYVLQQHPSKGRITFPIQQQTLLGEGSVARTSQSVNFALPDILENQAEALKNAREAAAIPPCHRQYPALFLRAATIGLAATRPRRGRYAMLLLSTMLLLLTPFLSGKAAIVERPPLALPYTSCFSPTPAWVGPPRGIHKRFRSKVIFLSLFFPAGRHGRSKVIYLTQVC